MTIRQDIEKERELRKAKGPKRTYIAQGLRAVEVPSPTKLFYCEECKGPVVESDRGISSHIERSARCAAVLNLRRRSNPE